MTIQDQILAAITMWRENRGGGMPGMQSVGNVIQNRATKSGQDVYTVCTKHAQFSSISMSNPEAYLWPIAADPQWQKALTLAQQMAAGTLQDITEGVGFDRLASHLVRDCLRAEMPQDRGCEVDRGDQPPLIGAL